MAAVGRRAPRIGRDGLTTGKRIQELRNKCGISLAMLASATGMTSQAIWKLETDGTNEPSYLNGLRIATALNVSPWHLAGEPDPSPDITFELDDVKIAIEAKSADGKLKEANAARVFVVDAIRTALTDYAANGGSGSVRMHLPKRQVYEGTAQPPPEMDLAELNQDLGVLALEVKKLRAEVQRLAKQADESDHRRVAKRAG